jgi:hypothetical protein
MKKTQVIELTSKRIKGHMVLATLTIIISFIILFVGGSMKSETALAISGFGIAGGCIWLFCAKVAQWWNHG